MRQFLVLTFLIAIDIYAFQAFRTMAQNWSIFSKNLMTFLYWTLSLVIVAYFISMSTGVISGWPKYVRTFLWASLFIVVLSKLMVVGFLLIDDFRRIVSWVIQKVSPGDGFSNSRSKFLATMGVAVGSIPFLTLFYGMIRNPYRYKLYTQKVKVKNLPASLNGLKIVQISDIHSGSFTFKEPVKNAVDLINKQQADLVFFTGDLVNSRADEMDDFMDVFDKIKAKHGVYSILGNHDYGDYEPWPTAEAKQANMNRMYEIHKELGWDLLLNENRMIDISDTKVAVLGVENYSTHPRFPRYGDLQKAHQGTEEASLKLLLSHDPTHWKDQVISTFKDIAITFSGHTHGMQFGVEIPGFLKWSPVQYVYKQWAGLYNQDEQFLYVNRGLGFLGYPGRVGILPEVAVIELQPA